MDEAAVFSLFSDRSYYSSHFMDVGWWNPFVHRVCQQHGFACTEVNACLPGTYPTFLAGLGEAGLQQPTGHVVVKFFGPLFNGEEAFLAEHGIANWLADQSLPIHSPCILAEGQLNQDWWYLIYEHIPGESISQVRAGLSPGDWRSVAAQLGEYLSKLHSLPPLHLPGTVYSIEPGWNGYASFLREQRSHCHANHQEWGDLPQHLLDQIGAFVLPVEQLIDFTGTPHLIHADLTADHLLGGFVNGGWQTLAIIDWGDARTGNLLYELVALHLDMFAGDKTLLKCFLESYGLPEFLRVNFPYKAFNMVLMHQFPMPPWVYAPYQDVTSLGELAEGLFGIKTGEP